jgi:hypothetical protein
MLEDLRSVDWASLRHAYGTAEDVPQNLRKLTSNDPSDWVPAIDALSWTILHQGTVYSATSYAVPFLLRLLDSTAIRCRARILELLAGIAAGTSYLEVHGTPSEFDDEREKAEFEAELADELAWARTGRDAVWDGWELFTSLLSNPDPRLRIAAGYALGKLCQTPPEARPHEVGRAGATGRIGATLRRQLEEEFDQLVKAGHIFAISALGDEKADVVDDLRRQLAAPSSPVVELAAAMCLVERGHAAPIQAIDVLSRSLSRGTEIDDLFDAGVPSVEPRHHPLMKAYKRAGVTIVETVGEEYHGEDAGATEGFRFPWLEGKPRFELIRRICQVPSRHLERILPALLGALRDELPSTVDLVSCPILLYLFGGEKLPSTASRTDLTSPQRAALEALFDNGALFAPSTSNCRSVLMSVGLPESRWKWERLLDRPGWQADTKEQIEANLARFVRHSARMPAEHPLTDEDRSFLKVLNLDEIVSADHYMPYLGEFPNLEVLRLCGSDVTDQGIRWLPALPRLRELYLYGNPITDEGAVAIGRLQNLEVLFVNKTGITDRGVQILTEALPQLRRLMLNATSVTDAAIPWLARLSHLEELNLHLTSVTREARETLRQRLPKCNIIPRM